MNENHRRVRVDLPTLFILVGTLAFVAVGITGCAVVYSNRPAFLLIGMVLLGTAIVWSLVPWKKRDNRSATRDLALAVLVSAVATLLAFAIFAGGQFLIFRSID